MAKAAMAERLIFTHAGHRKPVRCPHAGVDVIPQIALAVTPSIAPCRTQYSELELPSSEMYACRPAKGDRGGIRVHGHARVQA